MKSKISSSHIIGIILIILFVLIGYYFERKKSIQLSSIGYFTIAEIYDVYKVRGTTIYRYSFHYNGKDFKNGKETKNKDWILWKGKKCFVIFDPNDPETSLLLPTIEIPDYLLISKKYIGKKYRLRCQIKNLIA